MFDKLDRQVQKYKQKLSRITIVVKTWTAGRRISVGLAAALRARPLFRLLRHEPLSQSPDGVDQVQLNLDASSKKRVRTGRHAFRSRLGLPAPPF